MFDLSEHGNDEVDGGAAGDKSGEPHHQAGMLNVPHLDAHLDTGNIYLVRKVDPLTLG